MKFEFFVGDRVRATRTRKTDAAGDSTTATISGLQLGRAYVVRARWKNNVSATGDWSVRSVLVLEEEQPGQGSIARDLLATPGLVSSGNQATTVSAPPTGSTAFTLRIVTDIDGPATTAAAPVYAAWVSAVAFTGGAEDTPPRVALDWSLGWIESDTSYANHRRLVIHVRGTWLNYSATASTPDAVDNWVWRVYEA